MSWRQSLRRSPLAQLILSRLREFWREPSTIFWVYGFPILMVVALGIAFRNRPAEQISVDVVAGPSAEEIATSLRKTTGAAERPPLAVSVQPRPQAQRRLRAGRTDLLLTVEGSGAARRFQYIYDEARAESRLARALANQILQVAHGQIEPARLLPDRQVTEAGGRYIDFLVPGLLGTSLMGGGLWGVGYVIVDMRLRKLLKRFLATPMRRRDFLAGVMVSRLLFMIPEILVLLLFARLAFGVIVHGSVALVGLLVLLGAVTFAGIGLLVASRARTMETASGLMNAVMMPMYILSGVFFSWERFPTFLHPVIKALPLTALNDSLRAVILEGAGLAVVAMPAAVMATWASVSFVLALRWFRWS
jgi:ABC-2 type transport system permease protein